MTYQNDPDRLTDLDHAERPAWRYRPDGGFGWVPMILAVAAVILLFMLLLPARNAPGSQVTQNEPRSGQSTKPTPSQPPANKPAPTTPPPQ